MIYDKNIEGFGRAVIEKLETGQYRAGNGNVWYIGEGAKTEYGLKEAKEILVYIIEVILLDNFREHGLV